MTKKHKADAAAHAKDQILTAALTLAAKHGYLNVTRQAIADATGFATGTISWHFATMAQFRRSLMRAAVDRKDLAVIAQGLALKNAYALKASLPLRQQAANSIKG